jgi:hypothetical protein
MSTSSLSVIDRQKAAVEWMIEYRTPAEFVKLPLETRKARYKQFLVRQDSYVQIVEGDDGHNFNSTIQDGFLLTRQDCVGDDAAGRQISKEALNIYYTQNGFSIRSHWLRGFVYDNISDGKGERMDPLAREIEVLIDPEDTQWASGDLLWLLAFKKAELVTVLICGGGTLDGSDLLTQKKIQEIAWVVKRLINQFGDRFGIHKYHSECDLASYWDAPTIHAKEKVKNGIASFKELMQVQIEEWTREAFL